MPSSVPRVGPARAATVTPVFGSGKAPEPVRRTLVAAPAWHAPRVNWVFLTAAMIVIAIGVMLAVGRLDGELPENVPDRAPLALPDDRQLGRADVDGVKFAVGMRGYRMDEVDDVLDRLAAEVSQRDARITDLEDRLAARGVPRPDPVSYEPVSYEQVAHEPVAPEPVAHEPVAPEPVVHQPVDPEA